MDCFFFKLDKHKFGLKQHVILRYVYIPCEVSTFYADRPESDGIAKLESIIVIMMSDHACCNLFAMGRL